MTDTTPRPWFTADWQNDFGTNNVTIEIRINNGSTHWPDGIEKRLVASTEDGDNPLADAALIVTAVNAHDDLVKALEGFVSLYSEELQEHGYSEDEANEHDMILTARSALAKAKE